MGSNGALMCASHLIIIFLGLGRAIGLADIFSGLLVECKPPLNLG